MADTGRMSANPDDDFMSEADEVRAEARRLLKERDAALAAANARIAELTVERDARREDYEAMKASMFKERDRRLTAEASLAEANGDIALLLPALTALADDAEGRYQNPHTLSLAQRNLSKYWARVHARTALSPPQQAGTEAQS